MEKGMFQHMRDDAYKAAKAAEDAASKHEKLTQTEELTPEEMEKRAKAAAKEGASGTKEEEFELNLGDDEPLELDK